MSGVETTSAGRLRTRACIEVEDRRGVGLVGEAGVVEVVAYETKCRAGAVGYHSNDALFPVDRRRRSWMLLDVEHGEKQ